MVSLRQLIILKQDLKQKVNTLETEIEGFTNNKFRYRLNEEFVFPEMN